MGLKHVIPVLKKLAEWKLIIAFAACVQVYFGFIFFGIYPNKQVIILAFLSTFNAYIWHLAQKNKIWKIALFCSLFASIYFFSNLSSPYQAIFVFLALLGLSYHSFFRPLYGIKIFIIATSWAILTTLLPIIDQPWMWNISYNKISLFFVSKLLFLVAITIPFDIRDVQEDKNNHIATLPILIGIKASVLLSQILWVCSFVCFFLISNADLINVTTFSLGLYLLRKNNTVLSWRHYYVFLDGLLILHPALIIIFSR